MFQIVEYIKRSLMYEMLYEISIKFKLFTEALVVMCIIFYRAICSIYVQLPEFLDLFFKDLTFTN